MDKEQKAMFSDMGKPEFERMVGKLTAEQKVYAIYFRIF